jgi:hypothetical protein
MKPFARYSVEAYVPKMDIWGQVIEERTLRLRFYTLKNAQKVFDKLIYRYEHVLFFDRSYLKIEIDFLTMEIYS